MTVSQPTRPQPVRGAATFTAVTTAILSFIGVAISSLVLFDLVSWTQDQQASLNMLASAFIGVVVVVIALLKGGQAAEQVTPLENPHLAVNTPVNDGTAKVVPTPGATAPYPAVTDGV